MEVSEKQSEIDDVSSPGERKKLLESRSIYTKVFWAWLVLAFGAANVIFLGGKRRAFGMFVAQLHVEFRNTTTLAELNWIGDSYSAFGYLSTTLSSTLILITGRRFRLFQLLGSVFILLACVTSSVVPNAHWLFLTHTVFHGIGSSLILSVVGLIVSEYFPPSHGYRILATTLVSGGSVASIVFVQIFAALIQGLGWRNAFLVLGAWYFVLNALSAIFFAKNPEVEDYVNTTSVSTIFKEVDRRRAPYLALWFVDRVVTSIVTYGMLLNLADYVRRREKTLMHSTTLTILFASGEAATYAIGAIVTAFTKDLLRNRLKYVLLVCSTVLCASLILWEFFAYSKTLSYGLAALSGLMLGPSISFLFPAGEELTSLPGHLAYPFSLAGMGVGMAVSPLATALIAQSHDYRYFFLVQGLLVGVKCLALFAITLMQRLLKSQSSPAYSQAPHESDEFNEMDEKKRRID